MMDLQRHGGREVYIRINSTEGVMREITKRHDWEKLHRFSMTQKQNAFAELTDKIKIC